MLNYIRMQPVQGPLELGGPASDLPRPDKNDPCIETDYVISMECAASLPNTHNDEGPLSKPEWWRGGVNIFEEQCSYPTNAVAHGAAQFMCPLRPVRSKPGSPVPSDSL